MIIITFFIQNYFLKKFKNTNNNENVLKTIMQYLNIALNLQSEDFLTVQFQVV